MSGIAKTSTHGDTSILFFILIFLLLFYDDSAIRGYTCTGGTSVKKGDSSILFFILIFLLLFYK